MSMLEIKNTNVYDLRNSVIASGYAMQTAYQELTPRQQEEAFQKGLVRMNKLVNASFNDKRVHCHDNALTGIRVSFDIIYPQYITPELQRYHFLDIVTSSSKMHRLLQMDIRHSVNKYVDHKIIELLEDKICQYNSLQANIEEADGNSQQALYAAWMSIISNCPMGLELFMRCSTNYKQLQTIYFQRKNHRLREDWGAFRTWIESLPYAHELIIGDTKPNQEGGK